MMDLHHRPAAYGPLFFTAFLTTLFFAAATQAASPDNEIETEDISTPLCEELRPQLKEGDLIFTEIDNFLYRRVARVSGGWTSHVGVVFEEKGYGWTVYESRPPKVTRTPFCKFVTRSPGRFALSRWNHSEELDAATIQKMKKIGMGQMKRPYDLWFNYDSRKTTFCSKFVDSIYQGATGERVGTLETLKDLLSNIEETPFGLKDLKFWRYWFFGKIPWEQRTLSPQSQFEDSDFHAWFDSANPSH
jgi:hypothetical protein